MFQFKLRTAIAAAVIALPVSFAAQQASAIPVGLELSLVVDVSGSIDAAQFTLQKQGYVNAFNNAAVQNAIINSVGGAIAVNFIQWSGSAQQSTSVGFTLINSAASASQFATLINNAQRAFNGGQTAPGDAIQYAAGLLLNTDGFESNRQVMDVSGDGVRNDGIVNVAATRNAALAAGVDTINGLAIGGDPAVLSFYQNSIQGGANSFTIAAANFNDFGAAVQQKLIREISNVPEPASMALLGFGLAALGLVRRRRG